MAKSIIQEEKVCFVTGSTFNLDCHHCIHGSNRSNADKYGLTVWLRHDIHMALHAHKKPFQNLDKQLKIEAQKAFEKNHTREEFMSIFGINYIS